MDWAGQLCWADATKTGYFIIIVKEDLEASRKKVRCATLQPRGDGVYTIDPRHTGDSTLSKDKAFACFLFSVPGEAVREIPGGYKGEKAWAVVNIGRGESVAAQIAAMPM